MNILISENQLDKLKLKKLIFKYWDVNGPTLNTSMLRLFSVNQKDLKLTEIQRWLREYLGEEKIYEFTSNLLKQSKHIINDCGGYNFEFTTKYIIEDGQAVIDAIVDDINGEVTLIMVDGTTHKIIDARNQEFGWEIDNEIEDCLHDYFLETLEDKTGLPFVFDKIEFLSDKK